MANDFDYLPESAEKIVSGACICRFDYVVDRDDVLDAKEYGRLPRTKFVLVEYRKGCPYGNHAEMFLTTERSERTITE